MIGLPSFINNKKRGVFAKLCKCFILLFAFIFAGLMMNAGKVEAARVGVTISKNSPGYSSDVDRGKDTSDFKVDLYYYSPSQNYVELKVKRYTNKGNAETAKKLYTFAVMEEIKKNVHLVVGLSGLLKYMLLSQLVLIGIVMLPAKVMDMSLLFLLIILVKIGG